MTRDEWFASQDGRIQAMARNLHRRWFLPAGVTADDVEQEIRLGMLLAWDRWDPKYGRPRDQYLRLSSIAAAKSWIHAQRGAHKRRGTEPSRHAVLTDMDLFPDAGLAPDEAAALIEAVRRVLTASREERATICAAALEGGDYATGDWHARVLASRSVGMFAEVHRDDEEGSGSRNRTGQTGGRGGLGREVRAQGPR